MCRSIFRAHLLNSAATLANAYHDLEILPVCADYTQDFSVPIPERPVARTVAYFPGSTIGNLHPGAAIDLLRHMARVVGPNGGLLIGVDLQKDRETLERAYNDGAGVTAVFNLNMLARINRELGANFSLAQFRHHAVYNALHDRIEMHLISQRSQAVLIDDVLIPFERDESILTECSYKYTLVVREIGWAAGFSVEHIWTDPDQLFSVQYLSLIRVRQWCFTAG